MKISVAGRSYPLLIEPRAVTVSCDEGPESTPEKHLIFLHGWNADSSSLNSLHRALRVLPAAQQWNFWRVDYPTHRWSFARGAQEIAAVLRATEQDFSQTIFLGYSMGGVVARQIIADGFPCRALVSVAAPHGGLARWVPAHSPGTASLHRRSKQLAQLNQNAVDTAARSRFHLFSITYTDVLGFHGHDGLVMRCSALGLSLGDAVQRKNIHFNYGQPTFYGPHMRGMDARDMNAVIETCARLME